MGFFKDLTNYFIKTNEVAAVILLIGCFIVGIVSLFTNFLIGLLILFLGPLLVIIVFGFLAMVIEMYRNLEKIDQRLKNIDRILDSNSPSDPVRKRKKLDSNTPSDPVKKGETPVRKRRRPPEERGRR